MPENIKYIEPLSDFAFKKIFGSDPNKDLLIDFLNALFDGRKIIIDLIYNKNEHQGDSEQEGAAIFDLLCTGKDGEQFIIELQREKQENFRERALFYTSRLISSQAPRGNRKDWGYRLPEVHLIAIMENIVLADEEVPEFIHEICLCNRKTGEVFYEKLGYLYVELRKFLKEPDELKSDLDKWLYLLKNLSTMDKIPVYLRKPVFEKLFDVTEYSNLSTEDQIAYDRRRMAKWDRANTQAYAKKQAILEGRAEGLEEGRAEGRAVGLEEGRTEGIQEGRAKGLQEGHKEAIIKVAIAMKKEKVPPAQIAKFTMLTIEEIEQI